MVLFEMRRENISGSICNAQQMSSKRPPQKHIWTHEQAFQPYRGSDGNSIFSYRLTWGIWKHPTVALC